MGFNLVGTEKTVCNNKVSYYVGVLSVFDCILLLMLLCGSAINALPQNVSHT